MHGRLSVILASGTQLDVPAARNFTTGENLMAQILLKVDNPGHEVKLLIGDHYINSAIQKREQWLTSADMQITVVIQQHVVTSGKVERYTQRPPKLFGPPYVREFERPSSAIDPFEVMAPLPKFLRDGLERPPNSDRLQTNWGIKFNPDWLEPVYCDKCSVVTTVFGSSMNNWLSDVENDLIMFCGNCQTNPGDEIICICSNCEVPIRKADEMNINVRPQVCDPPAGEVYDAADEYSELYCDECSVTYGSNFTGA